MAVAKGQRKPVEIGRGVFLLRYESAEDDARPPFVRVHADGANLDLVLEPDAGEPVLWQPGACLVIRAERPGRLEVEVASSHPNGSVAARVKVEKLSQGDALHGAGPIGGAGQPLALDGFRLLGHVAGIGDVTVAADEWVAGPRAPSRIEGIAIEWPDKPAGLELRYAVKFAGGRGSQAGQSRMTTCGRFAGTRGRALPLSGIILEIDGMAGDVDLAVEALFLGSAPVRAGGKRVALSGPTGREPMVGLRVNLVERRAVVRMPVVSPVRPAAVAVDEPVARPSGRVRVFRSPAKQS